MDSDDIISMKVESEELCYDDTLIKETMNYLDELSKKKIQKKPEMDDAIVLAITFENERYTESMQVKFTYLQKKIYLNIDENWYKTELSIEDVWELQDKLVPKEKD
jgi:hypothetical protein